MAIALSLIQDEESGEEDKEVGLQCCLLQWSLNQISPDFGQSISVPEVTGHLQYSRSSHGHKSPQREQFL